MAREQHEESASDRLAMLLERWVEEAFPGPTRLARAGRLEQLWLALAEMLSFGGVAGSQGPRLGPFLSDLMDRKASGQAGFAPTVALRRRIEALGEEGVRAFFLALSLRFALDYLIRERFPEEYPIWQGLTEQLLPPTLYPKMSAGETLVHYRYGSFGPRGEQ